MHCTNVNSGWDDTVTLEYGVKIVTRKRAVLYRILVDASIKALGSNNSKSPGLLNRGRSIRDVYVDFVARFQISLFFFSPRNVIGEIRLKRTEDGRRHGGAKYRRFWNLTRDKGIARPPTSRWEVLEVEAPSNGSVNFRAR